VYDFDATVNSHPIYKSRKHVPANYSEHPGKDIYLYYHEVAQAWAIACEFGELDVFAFVNDTAKSPEAVKSTWYVRADAGYMLDPAVSVMLSKLCNFCVKRALLSESIQSTNWF
jgi:hypothetical protein